jgi:hypothetical protein
MASFRSISWCCLLSVTSPAFAVDTAASLRYPSPKGDLVVVVEQHPEKPDTARLEDASGKVFLTLAVEDGAKEGAVMEGSMVWSAGADGVAFAVGNSQLFKAHAFIRTKDGWKHIKLPEPGDGAKIVWDNYHAVPAKWTGDRLTLTVSGPHVAKTDNPTYTGSMIVAIDVEGGTAKKVEESIVVAQAKESP